MIPSKALDVEKRSGEEEIFNILKEKLPPNVYVAHSFEIKDIDNVTGEIYESEIDFLAIIPNEGCLIIESKNARIYPEAKGISYNYYGTEFDYLWHLPNGEVMKYNGPFRQAERSMRNFTKYLRYGRAKDYGFYDKVTFTNCVLLPLINQNTVNSWKLPADAGSVKFILSKDDLRSKDEDHLYKRILEIIKLQKNKNYKCMDEEECRRFIQTVVAPRCNLLPSKNLFVNLQNERLDAFLHQQLVILDFMEEQKIAVISGGAGTGKTKIALEKAKRLSDEGKKVLFLCFNRKLKEHLAREYQFENIRYETIDSLYYSYFGNDANDNYNPLRARIDKDYEKGIFPYKNFIVDEAQDFGRKDIEGSGFLKLLQDIAEIEDDGCCYFFYDKYQLVQSKEIPSVIRNADCKMTLYKNCRNTQNIANTSYKVFTEEELSKRDIKGFEIGDIPRAINCSKADVYETVVKMVTFFRNKGYKDIVVLSAREEGGSALSEKARGDYLFIDGFKCLFTTCRKFKGLEAEAVIVVDVDASVLLSDNKRLLFYVGTSRAKFDLGIVFNVDDDEFKAFLKKRKMQFPIFNKNLLFSIFGTELLVDK